MRLTRLSLSNYRNYEQLTLNCDHQVMIFIGQNAQGKTNVLESIYVLALTKSHRTSKDKELIRFDSKAATIHAELDKKYGHHSLEISFSPQGKKVKINRLEQKKLSQFVGTLNVVLFAPEDLEIVKGAPVIRRRFIDMELGQVQPNYLYELMQYQKVLVQRNNLLKQPNPPQPEMLEIWDQQLAQFGTKIILKRQKFIQKLQIWAEKIHSGITGGKEKLEIRYSPSFSCEDESDEAVVFNQFMIKLSQAKPQELRRGTTLVGPHRDDLLFYINGKEAQTYGSQGQQRTTALSLKLAEIELIHEEVGEYPILLLDDVLSELDRSRQTQLIETIQDKVQTFITTTSIDSVDFKHIEDVGLYLVEEGAMRELASLEEHAEEG